MKLPVGTGATKGTRRVIAVVWRRARSMEIALFRGETTPPATKCRWNACVPVHLYNAKPAFLTMMHRCAGRKERETRGSGRLERSAKRAGEHPLPQDARLSFSFFRLRLCLTAARTHWKTNFPNREETNVLSRIKAVSIGCVKIYRVIHA